MTIKTNADIAFSEPVGNFSYRQTGPKNDTPAAELPVQTSESSAQNPAFKRAFDLIAGLAILLVILPLLPLIALAIKLESPGPVFFRQSRSGLNGVPFRIFKFRTMTVDGCNSGFRQAQRNDSRITRVGAFLRKTSLDELPQLFNVISGEMSLVGPRPHVRELDEWSIEHVQGYTGRWAAKPGITGWAQVKGLRGETPTPDVMRERVEADVWYARNAGVVLDIKILFLTLLVVLGQKNAF